jgi:broad specificity phosphatase PhoE
MMQTGREQTPRDATLILVRHGETAWNREGRWQGQHDPSLTEVGREQGRRIAQRLAGVEVSAVYSSDLSRARETAELVAASHGLQVRLREELRERSFGVLEGKTPEEAARSEGVWFLTWQADHLRQAPPAGESQPAMCERVMAALYQIAEAHPGERVVVVTHGGPIKSAIFHLLSIPLGLWRLAWVSNGSITTLRGTPDVMRVATLNDTCHLEMGLPSSDGTED